MCGRIECPPAHPGSITTIPWNEKQMNEDHMTRLCIDASMIANATDLGTLLAEYTDSFARFWIATVRRLLVDTCDSIGTRGLLLQLDRIDALLDVIEARRSEVRSLAQVTSH
jgi:hypothetical protein